MKAPLPRSEVELLERLLLGQLSPAEADQLAARFAGEERLAGLAESLDVGPDVLLGTLRHHQPLDDPGAESLVRRLLQRLRDTGVTQDTAGHTPGDAESAAPAAEPLPESFEYFRVRQLLGEGGMGKVYLAEDTRLGRPVALKTIRREAVEKPGAKERFLREARSAARLEHDHIVPIYYVGEADGAPFLAMPYLQGEGLDRRLRRDKEAGRAMPVVEAVRIARQIASGLARAHSQGLIHRDIKPNNVWLEAVGGPAGEPRVRILDFGLARSQQDDASLTASGVVLGTPAYMAPEQARGLPLDPRADLFSLGCVLYQMVTGDRPFTGTNHLAVLTSLAVDTPPAPHEVRTDCPRELSDLTMRLLAKQPEGRPASAEEVVRLLTGLQDALSRPPADPTPAAAGSSRRRGRYLVAAGLLALLPLGWWLAGLILRFETKDGTLVVELADTDVEARLKNGELQLVGPDGKVRYTLKPSERNRAAVAPGDYQVSVVGADGLALDTSKFEMKQGGLVTVRVTVQPRAAKAAAPAPHPDPDRAAAEFALSLGGQVDLNDGQNPHQFKTAADLPSSRFRLTCVVLQSNPRVNDAGMAVFERCNQLTSLVLSGSPVNEATLAHFRNCTNLKELYLNSTPVGDGGLAHFGKCVRLTSLSLEHTKVTDAGLAHFKNCRDLVGLGLNHTEITDDGLANLKGNTRLEALTLSRTHVTDQGLVNFQVCKKLRVLSLGQTRIADTGLAHFRGNKDLKDLELHHTGVSDDGLAHFADCKKLTRLRLEGCKQVTDRGLSHFKGCENLSHLQLGGTQVSDVVLALFKHNHGWTFLDVSSPKVTDAGLAHLHGFENLGYLDLNDTQVSDAALARFRGCRKLTNLGLAGTRVTEAGLVNFKDCQGLKALNLARLPVTDDGLALFQACRSLWYLDLLGTRVSDRSLAQLKGYKELTTLDLRQTRVSEAGVNELKAALPRCDIFWEPGPPTSADRHAAEYVISIGGAVQVNGLEREYRQEPDLPRGRFRLTGVFFGKNVPVNDAGLAVFRECKHLTRLNLYYNASISDAGLAHFKNCKNWRHLELSGTKATDAGLEHFKDCPNLQLLGLENTPVTDLGMARFKDCKRLEILNLSGIKISDAGLAYFKGCSELTDLYLNELQISEEGMSHFKDCRKLKNVVLYKSTVDDAGLSQLPPQLELELLNVGGTNVTDVGLAHFKNLSKIKELGLNYKMTDASLARLKECKNLPGIGLPHMRITEVGVRHLKECGNLKWLDLRNTKVTATGIEVLKKALPRCRITWDGGVIEPPREAGK